MKSMRVILPGLILGGLCWFASCDSEDEVTNPPICLDAADCMQSQGQGDASPRPPADGSIADVAMTPLDGSVDAVIPEVSCPVGRAECGGAPGDCETDITNDPLNCGRCARACGGTAACTNRLCQATVILNPVGVNSNWCGGAFSATTAYMITCWGGELSEVRTAPLEPGADLEGTRIRHYTNVSVVAMRGILIDGNDVYYGLEGTPSNLWKFPLNATGTADVTVGVTMENGIRFDGLQLVGDTYYWIDNDHTGAGVIAGARVYKRGKSDVASTALVTGLGLGYGLQVTPTKLVWLDLRGSGSNITVHVARAPIAGAAFADVESLATATGGSYMVKRGEHVYWTVKSAKPNGKIQRLRYADTAAMVQDVVVGLDLPEGLQSDANFVYFKQQDALYRAPLDGGPAEQLSIAIPAHDTQATEIHHVDQKYVYFSAGPGFGDSTLVRVAK
jgi:hypothetical protein